MQESRSMEWKETINNTFLKTVSAYANYGDGVILFGVTDSGEEVGLKDMTQASLDIEHRINDSIQPRPEYSLERNPKTHVISLYVKEGPDKPYLYHAKAYTRRDTSTVEVDRVALHRLLLEGQNRSFEEEPAPEQALTFHTLERHLRAVLDGISPGLDTLRTLELYSEASGYNVAAALLADRNRFPGIDMIRFGENEDIMTDRQTIDHCSVLTQYEEALQMYRRYYQLEQVLGSTRQRIERVPETAFREAVLNGLVHRTWDVPAHIRIAMYDDHIDILSPGGLPSGISETEYLAGQISLLRNPILGNVFFRLHYIERFRTGIARINRCYLAALIKPTYEVYDNSIRITLPLLTVSPPELNEDEQLIYHTLSRTLRLSSSELLARTGLRKNKLLSLLHRLEEKGFVQTEGHGRATRYRRTI